MPAGRLSACPWRPIPNAPGTPCWPTFRPIPRNAPDCTEEARLSAERLRGNLIRLVTRRGTNLGCLARACGMPSANALYNFLGGRSRSLSMATLQRLVAALDVSMDELLASEKSNEAELQPEPRLALEHLAGSLDALHAALLAATSALAATAMCNIVVFRLEPVVLLNRPGEPAPSEPLS